NSNSATFYWKPSGSETQWQYVLGTATDMSPFVLPVKDVLNPVNNGTEYTTTLNGLLPNTTTKIWFRSKCNSGASSGTWVGPFALTTSCAPGTEFNEKFDAGTTIPACWS